jgi:hypothetical protein
MSRLPRFLLPLCLATVVVGAATPAFAQRGYYPPPPPRYAPYRQGITLGAGIGVGGMSADNCGDSCGAGPAFEFHIGGMLTPRLALMFDIFPVIHPINSDVSAYNTQYTIAAQFFATEQFWLKGGVGFAHYSETSDFYGGLGSDWGSGITLAGGFEIYNSGPFAIDLQLRLGRSFYDVAKDHGVGAFLIGFNWY